ncbi:Fe2+/Zn2+ uptake regulation protein [Halobacteroides halobius DSM 5150]|uniref:Fe2+/Zn2+ uptake regulation protein n=1 Tax=Halobacteroides halobius (strain ATCC 35273 / DSM 5150 / MD-1) TaxID=748449 RepID=L0KB17_HALHC|nr:Fur family transcriptional regulator [Halobacteroides halobius]AGB41569.1 Fe2+/Zn2+ uptake regulation protein [Halobacteroides halobius DSM 5150]
MEQLLNWEERLKNKGIRCTKQRIAILKILITSDTPISAQEIFSQLDDSNSKVRLSTVYRNLNQFVAEGIVRKLNFADQKNKFELVDDHHHHLVCLECDEVRPLECPLEQFDNQLSTKTGYKIIEHRIKFYGLCPKCQENKES